MRDVKAHTALGLALHVNLDMLSIPASATESQHMLEVHSSNLAYCSVMECYVHSICIAIHSL